MRLTLLNDPFGRTHSFPKFFMVPGAFGEFDGGIRSQFSIRRVDFVGWEPWDTQPNWIHSFNRASDPFCTTLVWLFVGLLLRLNMSKTAHYAITASCSWLVFLIHGRLPVITWRVFTFFTLAKESAPFSPRALTSAAWGFEGFLPVSLCLCIGCKTRWLAFSVLTLVSVSRYRIMGETTWVSFGLQWNREWFFFRHMLLNSRFNMVTINEITLNGQKVPVNSCVIFCFFKSKLFPLALRFSAEILSPYSGFPSQSGFLEFVVSSC